MKALPEPQLGNLLCEYYNELIRPAKCYSSASLKMCVAAMQSMQDIINYMIAKDVLSLSDLTDRLLTVNQKIQLRKNQIESKKEEASRFRDMACKGNALLETKAVYEEYQKIFFPSAKKRFMEAHGKELRKYFAARRYFVERNLEPAPDLIRTWKAKADECEKEISSLYEGMKPLTAERYNLEGILKIAKYSMDKRTGISPEKTPRIRIVDESIPAWQKSSVLDRLSKKQREVQTHKAPGRNTRSFPGIE